MTERRPDYLPFGRPNFSEAEIEAVAQVLRSGWIGMGTQTQAFEQELASYLGAPYVVAVNSCTSALFLSLLVFGIGPGDEVICPSLTWCATANAALYLGARPVFCDIDGESLCAAPDEIRAKLSVKTRAVVLVHYGGLAIDVEAVRAVLPGSVAIVEDAAHAFGSRFPNGVPVGSSGNLTCFSFYANKNLSTGEGGAVALFDESLADRLRSLRQNGMPVNAWQRFTHPKVLSLVSLTELGYKMNYTDLQACIGRVQLKRQAELNAARLAIAQRYRAGLAELSSHLSFQRDLFGPGHARHLFVAILKAGAPRRDELLRALRARNVGASVHYAPLHDMPLYQAHGRPSLPVTDEIAQRILTLPISSSMTVADADYVVGQLRELLG